MNNNFKQDFIDGLRYNLWLPNTLKDVRELSKSALAVFIFLLCGLSIYFVIVGDYSFWGILSFVGLIVSSINLILVDNGKLSSFIWAILCSICSLIGAIKYSMFADAVYYIWCLPWLLYGIAEWQMLSRQEDSVQRNTTQSRRLNAKQVVLYSFAWIISYASMFAISSCLGGAIPIIDSAILAFGIVGQVLLSKSYRAQWVIWLAQDIIAVIAWSVRLNMAIVGGEETIFAISMVIMWGIFLVNAVYGTYQWYHNSSSSKDVQLKERA